MYQMGLLSLCNKLFVYKYINKFTISPVFMRNLRCLTEWNDGRLSFHQEMHSLPAEVSSVSHLCKDKKKICTRYMENVKKLARYSGERSVDPGSCII